MWDSQSVWGQVQGSGSRESWFSMKLGLKDQLWPASGQVFKLAIYLFIPTLFQKDLRQL